MTHRRAPAWRPPAWAGSALLFIGALWATFFLTSCVAWLIVGAPWPREHGGMLRVAAGLAIVAAALLLFGVRRGAKFTAKNRRDHD